MLSWKFYSLIKTYCNCTFITTLIKIYYFNENLELWENVIIVIKSSKDSNNIHQFDYWWILLYSNFKPVINMYHCYQNLSLWYKFTTVMKICHSDEGLSLRLIVINVINIYRCNKEIITEMKIHQCDENELLWWKLFYCDKD